MEDLAGRLEGSFNVSNDKYSTSGVHPRFSQFKSKTAGPSDQEVRRQRRLEQQKEWVVAHTSISQLQLFWYYL